MSDYKLNPEAKPFSYTRENLFSCITKIVGHSSSTEARALAILVVIEDYLANFTERGGDGEYYIPECDETDFIDFVREKLGIDDYDAVNVESVLK
jgi:hypothetical protein